MGSRHFPQLFAPGRLGATPVRNRIIMPAMDTVFAETGGTVGQRLLDYYRRRAAGGVGAVVVEICAVAPEGLGHTTGLRLDHDRYVPGQATLAAAIKAGGAAAFLQLHHCGRQGSPLLNGGQEPVAPSAIPCPLVKVMPRALVTAEIGALVEQYAAAARRAQQAGYDGVELHGAHGYLLHQFLSPLSNQRTDAYGGSLENRARLPLAVVGEIRRRLGPNFTIIYRLSGDEGLEGGYDLAAVRWFGAQLAAAGADALHVSAGTYASMEYVVQPMQFPPGCLLPLARAIRAAVPVPVIAVGRIATPALAESALARGDADFVAMGRALVADPDLPAKAAAGAPEQIRPCVACNECMARAFAVRPMHCTVNPEVGREAELAADRPAAPGRRVLVAGAGPAGLETALRLAARGHRVEVFEREPVPGRKLLICAAAPDKHLFNTYRDWLLRELKRRDIRLFSGCAVDTRTVQDRQPDAVVVATGGVPQIPDLPGVDLPHVRQAEAVLLGPPPPPGARAVVIGGSGTGCEVADWLAAHGAAVTVVARGQKFARSVEPITRKVLLRKLRAAGVQFLPGSQVQAIEPDAVLLAGPDGTGRRLPASLVVLARGYDPDSRLYQDLVRAGFEAYLAGDAGTVGNIVDAVGAGARLALRI